jgi:hypothetical protein
VATLNLLLALALPSALGAVLVALLLDSSTPGRKTLVFGHGILLGFMLVALLLRGLDAFGVELTFSAGAVPLALLLLLVTWLYFYLGRGVTGPLSDSGATRAYSRTQLVLFMFFLVLIYVRILSVGLELIWRPLFPWDATMHWATKARVWFDAQAIVPFVDNQRWLEMAGVGVYTDHHADYPITTPLLQLWMSLALGYWSESLMNLPWLFCFAGLALAFFGQARAAGCSSLAAIVFTYLLVSMPLLNTHVALAGYADMFLGVFYCTAIMAFYNWSVSNRQGQALLAVIFALYLPMIKNEGFFWLLTFLPALMVVWLPWRNALALIIGGMVAVLLLLVFLPPDLVIAGNSMEQLNLKFRPAAFSGIATSIWVQDNWHLLGYLLPALGLLLVFSARSATVKYRGIGVALLSAIVLFLALFLYTKHSGGAVRFTSLGRISLHLIPSLMFLAMLFWRDVSQRPVFGRFREAADSEQSLF